MAKKIFKTSLILLLSISILCGCEPYKDPDGEAIQSLLSATEENLLYASYLRINGTCNYTESYQYKTANSPGKPLTMHTVNEDTTIKYKRTYQDSQNYMSCLSASGEYAYTNINANKYKPAKRQYGYTGYYGVVDDNEKEHLECNDFPIKKAPVIEDLICPDLTDCGRSLDYSDPDYYILTITYGFAKFDHYVTLISKEYRADNYITGMKYYYDKDTKVLKRIEIQGSKDKTQTKEIATVKVTEGFLYSFNMELNISEYSFKEHKMIVCPEE